MPIEPGPSSEHAYLALGFPVCEMGALMSAFPTSESTSESLALLPQALIAPGERPCGGYLSAKGEHVPGDSSVTMRLWAMLTTGLRTPSFGSLLILVASP